MTFHLAPFCAMEEEEQQHVSDQPEGVVISDISEEGGPDAWPGDACGFLER